MNAYVLEVVDSAGAKRGGRTYWTHEAAVREAERLVRTKRAAKVRILEVAVRERPIAEVPTPEIKRVREQLVAVAKRKGRTVNPAVLDGEDEGQP